MNHAIAWRGSWGNDGILAFVNCVFENNGNAGFMESEWETEGSYALQNCTFSNNRWGEAACPATPTSSTVLVNGEKTAFDAYSINGNNYFKLRDIGQTFDFGINWDGGSRTITIDTPVPYTAE